GHHFNAAATRQVAHVAGQAQAASALEREVAEADSLHPPTDNRCQPRPRDGPHPPAPSPNPGRGGVVVRRVVSIRYVGCGMRAPPKLPLSQDWERGPGGEGRRASKFKLAG